MHEHRCGSSIELIERRRKAWIAQPFAGVARVQADAVELELVECMFNFRERAGLVRQRDWCERAKTSFVVAHHLRGKLIEFARSLARRTRIAEPETWTRQ